MLSRWSLSILVSLQAVSAEAAVELIRRGLLANALVTVAAGSRPDAVVAPEIVAALRGVPFPEA